MDFTKRVGVKNVAKRWLSLGGRKSLERLGEFEWQ
jgi:hypothetical protein